MTHVTALGAVLGVPVAQYLLEQGLWSSRDRFVTSAKAAGSGP
jgi:hypothetical protein